MQTLLNLLEHIKGFDTANREELIEELNCVIRAFSQYYSMILTNELADIFAETKESGLRLEQAENASQGWYNDCVEYCNRINDIAVATGYDLYVNTSDSRTVKCFVGDTVRAFYYGAIGGTIASATTPSGGVVKGSSA